MNACTFCQFHAILHALPPHAGALGEPITMDGTDFIALRVVEQMTQTPFAVTFEQVCERWNKLPRMFLEPDGWFLYTGQVGSRDWQVEGQLTDRAERLLFVQLKGSCPAEVLDNLLSACGWPETSVMFQLVRQAVFLDESTFRRQAAASRLFRT
jgi:hypothetical protein